MTTLPGATLLKPATFLAASVPLLVLAGRAATGNMGANPVERALNDLGFAALVLLLASLVPTPLKVVAGWKKPLKVRRMLGLWSFAYAVLHVLAWVVAEHQLDVAEMLDELLRRWFIISGALAFLLLVPLAATSTTGMVQRLGARAWQRLHRLVYPAACLGTLHFAWRAKVVGPEHYAAMTVLALLLGVRAVAAAKQEGKT